MLRALDSEHMILGAVMAYPDDCEDAFNRLSPDHFSEGLHQRLWGAILLHRAKGACSDPAVLNAEFQSDPAYVEFGGISYLADLVDRAQTWALKAHVDLVCDRALRRAVKDLAERAINQAQLEDVDGAVTLADLERAAAELGRQEASPAKPLGIDALDMLNAARSGQYKGSSVGLRCLDRVTGGIQQDHVWIVGGRTSMGKSVVLTELAKGIASQGKGVMMFSLEMPRREVQARVIAGLAYDPEKQTYGPDGGNVQFPQLLRGEGTREQRQWSDEAARQLASLPFVVDDDGGLKLEQIINRARRQFRAWERAGVQPGALVIDHLGLVQPGRKTDNKAADVSETVDQLKAAAKMIGAPIIAAAQLNRNAEGRNDKRPMTADLNWSGSIEQIADLVCLLFRESYYLERSANPQDKQEGFLKRNELELLVTKNRSGPTCVLKASVDVACNAVWDHPDDVAVAA